MKQQITVPIYETELEVTYEVHGKDLKASREDPEEDAWIEITEVRVRDLDIEVSEMLSKGQIEKIKSLIIEAQ